jgi:hypothetical protein
MIKAESSSKSELPLSTANRSRIKLAVKLRAIKARLSSVRPVISVEQGKSGN